MKTNKLVLFVVLTLTIGISVSSVNANFTPLPDLPTPIYIREDGKIEGGDGCIQQNGNVYTFTQNINKTIEIQKDNTVLDGKGFTLTRPPDVNIAGLMTPLGWFPLILVSNTTNVIIKNINLEDYCTGISVKNSSNITIIQNNIQNGGNGIYMISTNYSNIIANEIVDNSGAGLEIRESSYLNIAFNTISKNRFHGAWISVSYSNITRNNITNNVGSNVGIGLYLYGPNSNNRFFENNFIDNQIGMLYQGQSINNRVFNNYLSNTEKEMGNTASDGSDSDNSPLSSPVSTAFEPSFFPLPDLDVAEFPEWIFLPLIIGVPLLILVYKKR
jgi:parallel beta-helix repeat protein